MEYSKDQKILQRVLTEAWNNPTYKAELIANPTEAVKNLTGENFTLPEGKTLEVCDQSNVDKVYLNISPRPNFDNVELTDHQLEEVAGGRVPMAFINAPSFVLSPAIIKPQSPSYKSGHNSKFEL